MGLSRSITEMWHYWETERRVIDHRIVVVSDVKVMTGEKCTLKWNRVVKYDCIWNRLAK